MYLEQSKLEEPCFAVLQDQHSNLLAQQKTLNEQFPKLADDLGTWMKKEQETAANEFEEAAREAGINIRRLRPEDLPTSWKSSE